MSKIQGQGPALVGKQVRIHTLWRSAPALMTAHQLDVERFLPAEQPRSDWAEQATGLLAVDVEGHEQRGPLFDASPDVVPPGGSRRPERRAGQDRRRITPWVLAAGASPFLAPMSQSEESLAQGAI